MKCKVCNREAITEYCELHEKARENIVKNYDTWKKALALSWIDYLNKIIKNSYTGLWAKEVAERLHNEKLT